MSTTRMLMGTCLAAAAGSRSTSWATPSDTATSTPTVKPFSDRTSPIASATRTPSTTAALRCSALRTEARTETCTTTTAVSGASTGAGTPVTTRANHHDNPAARPDLATVPISVDVGGVHATASARRRHHRRSRGRTPLGGCVATAERYCRHPKGAMEAIVLHHSRRPGHATGQRHAGGGSLRRIDLQRGRTESTVARVKLPDRRRAGAPNVGRRGRPWQRIRAPSRRAERFAAGGPREAGRPHRRTAATARLDGCHSRRLGGST